MTVPLKYRKELPRLTGRRATVLLLQEAQQRLNATIGELSERAVLLRVPAAVPHDCAVRIDFEDCMFFGEVASCLPAADGFECNVWLEEVLTGVDDVRRLMTAIMGNQRNAAPVLQPGRFSGAAGES